MQCSHHLRARGTSYRHRWENKNLLLQEKQVLLKLKDLLRRKEAEVKQESLPYKDRDHALFVAYAPYDDPKYAISVLVEHGGSGGKTAAPIAKKIIKKVLERHELRQRINKLLGEEV